MQSQVVQLCEGCATLLTLKEEDKTISLKKPNWACELAECIHPEDIALKDISKMFMVGMPFLCPTPIILWEESQDFICLVFHLVI